MARVKKKESEKLRDSVNIPVTAPFKKSLAVVAKRHKFNAITKYARGVLENHVAEELATAVK